MFAASIVKEIQLLLRDRGALASMFLLPLAFIGFFGFMFGDESGGDGESARERTVVVSYDEANDAGFLAAEAVDQAEGFAVARRDTAAAVRAAVAAGDERVGLVFPDDFDPLGGKPAELVIDQASSLQFRGPIQGALTQIIAKSQLPQDPSLDLRVLEARTPPGMKQPVPNISGFQLAVPGNAVLFAFFIAITIGISFIEERDSGTWRRLLASPVRRPVLLFAKLVPFFVVACLQLAFLFGLGAAFFGMTVGGSLAGVVLISALTAYCAVALGLFIASFGGTPKAVGGFGSIVILIMGMLGGAMVPRIAMPEALQTAGLVVPHGWALDAYTDLLVREGTTVADVALPAVVLFAMGTALAGIGAARFKFV